jgi:hypothetical protein
MGEWNNRRQWNVEVGRRRQTFVKPRSIHTYRYIYIYIYISFQNSVILKLLQEEAHDAVSLEINIMSIRKKRVHFHIHMHIFVIFHLKMALLRTETCC